MNRDPTQRFLSITPALFHTAHVQIFADIQYRGFHMQFVIAAA